MPTDGAVRQPLRCWSRRSPTAMTASMAARGLQRAGHRDRTGGWDDALAVAVRVLIATSAAAWKGSQITQASTEPCSNAARPSAGGSREKVQRIIDERSYRPDAQARGLKRGGQPYLLGLIGGEQPGRPVHRRERSAGVLNHLPREQRLRAGQSHPCGTDKMLSSEVVSQSSARKDSTA